MPGSYSQWSTDICSHDFECPIGFSNLVLRMWKFAHFPLHTLTAWLSRPLTLVQLHPHNYLLRHHLLKLLLTSMTHPHVPHA
ncbi:hypothetical protein CLOM_g15884 [Closterium sp. NIES-68]|nr:hypothetical protein CLOM_g15884 [Closterium sp. NIES-68]GJP69630.1 hypothetical protein CLOP_g620 [Closterium sp. NIES-67]